MSVEAAGCVTLDAMSRTATPAHVLGRLADERRLRAVAAVALGDRTVAAVAERVGLSRDEAARALAQLIGAGIVTQQAEGLQVDLLAFADAARSCVRPTAVIAGSGSRLTWADRREPSSRSNAA